MKGKDFFRRIMIWSLFWAHIGIVFFIISMGFILSLPKILALIILHRTHTAVFKDCVLSKMQRYLGGMPKEMTFVQFASYKLLGMSISRKQNDYMGYAFTSFSVMVAVLRYL